MSDLQHRYTDLVTANRILAHEGVVDAFGHVSMRHPERPDRFILSYSRSPELVQLGDLSEFDLRGTPIEANDRKPYLERFIHAAIYAARADVGAVVHNHSHAVIPLGITGVALRPVFHVGALMGEHVPVWDIGEQFGDTDLLVASMEHAEDLAHTLATHTAALMRGHGCVVVGSGLQSAVATAIYMHVNARLQLDAARLGPVRYLSPEEVRRAARANLAPLAVERAWEYWKRRALPS